MIAFGRGQLCRVAFMHAHHVGLPVCGAILCQQVVMWGLFMTTHAADDRVNAKADSSVRRSGAG